MTSLSIHDLEAALPLLERMPDPALWIEPDYQVRWRNAEARAEYGSEPGSCFEVSHGRRHPCDVDGEVCPKHDAELDRAPREVLHAHCRDGAKSGVYRVLALPIEGGGVLEIHYHLGQTLVHDALTGLYRREYWLELVERSIALLQRLDRPYAVVFADVDHFKEFNDARGHLVGDDLLRQLGATILRHVRKSDVACRWGGEEFVLFLPNTTVGPAVRLADRIRSAVRQIEIAGETPRVTASFGVHAASCLHPLSEVLRKADAALFTAKARGRNLVHTYQRAPRRGATASEPDQPRAAELEEEHGQ